MVAYRNASRHQIAFVQDENEMFMRSLFPEVLFNTATPCPLGVSGVENMNDNIRRIHDLVQLIPYTLTLPL